MSNLEKYKKMFPKNELCPISDISGNKFLEDIDYNVEMLYEYCVEHRKTWEEVLNFKYDPNAIY